MPKKLTPRQREKRVPGWAVYRSEQCQDIGITSFREYDKESFFKRLLGDRIFKDSNWYYFPDLHKHYYQVLHTYPKLQERLNVVLDEINKTVFKDIIIPVLMVRNDKATFRLFCLPRKPRVRNRFWAYNEVYERLASFAQEVWIDLELPEHVPVTT